MKTLQISKFSLFMMSIVVFAIAVFAMIVYNSPSNVTKEPDRIYLHSDFSNIVGRNGAPKYVKIQDMKPNDFGYFAYPSSYNFSDNANTYQRFLLIRLPSWLGGDKNGTSSFRAYSAVDPTSHCIMKYWPQDGRQRIEDPCISQPYRAIDGVSYDPGLTMIRSPTTGALPKLDLDVDSQGYLVVKPPTWTQNKNGVIGIGRDVSKDEILQSSKTLLTYCKDQIEWPELPFELQTGDVLIDVSCKSDQIRAVYTNIDDPYKSARIDMNFCNCTKTPHELGPWINSENGQFWNIKNTTIYVSGNALQTGENKFDPRYAEYNFRFTQNGYEIIFTDTRPFDDSAKEVLRIFFNDNNLSDLKRVQ